MQILIVICQLIAKQAIFYVVCLFSNDFHILCAIHFRLYCLFRILDELYILKTVRWWTRIYINVNPQLAIGARTVRKDTSNASVSSIFPQTFLFGRIIVGFQVFFMVIQRLTYAASDTTST